MPRELHARTTTNTSLKKFCELVAILLMGFVIGSQFTLFKLAHQEEAHQEEAHQEVDLTAVLSTTIGVMRSSNGQRDWDQWPAVANEAVGHPLVAKGDSFYDHARELYFTSSNPLIHEFLEVYKNRPDPVNLCGIRINHAMALFLAVKQLNPTLVVESGVNAGVSTYFIRKASPTTRIFAVDPLDKPICDQGDRWIDDTRNNLTTYYTGSNFVDIMDMDWKGMLSRNEFDPESTLIFLDDHLHTFERIAGVMAHGIRNIVVEDNYKQGEGATPMDRRSTPKQMLAGGRWRSKGDWLWGRMAKYSEFPPLVPPIVAKEFDGPRKRAGGFMVASDDNMDIVHPILRPDLDEQDLQEYQRIATYLEIDPSLKDRLSNMQFMNYNQFCYLQLTPEAAATASTAPTYN